MQSKLKATLLLNEVLLNQSHFIYIFSSVLLNSVCFTLLIPFSALSRPSTSIYHRPNSITGNEKIKKYPYNSHDFDAYHRFKLTPMC